MGKPYTAQKRVVAVIGDWRTFDTAVSLRGVGQSSNRKVGWGGWFPEATLRVGLEYDEAA